MYFLFYSLSSHQIVVLNQVGHVLEAFVALLLEPVLDCLESFFFFWVADAGTRHHQHRENFQLAARLSLRAEVQEFLSQVGLTCVSYLTV